MVELALPRGDTAETIRIKVDVAHGEGLMVVDAAGVIVTANEAAHALFGAPPQSLQGTRLNPQQRMWKATLSVPLDGATRLLEARAVPAPAAPEGLVVIRLSDITGQRDVENQLREALADRDRLLALSREMRLAQLSVLEDQLQAQEALQESERFLWATLDGLKTHIAILDEQGAILLVNRAWREFALANGGDPQEMSEGANYLQVCAQAGRDGFAPAAEFGEGIKAVLSGSRADFSMEYPCDSPDEVRRFIARVTPFPGEGPRRVVVAHENITERVLAEEALRESEQHYRNLADSSSALIWTSDEQWVTNYSNRRAIEYTGRSLAHETLDGWVPLIHPDDAEQCAHIFQEAFARREAFRMDYRLARHDGVYRWFQADGSPRYDSQGRFLGYIGHLVDITERKLAEERVAHLNGVLRSIRDVNQLMLRVSDQSTLIAGASELISSMPGYASSVLVLVDADGRPTLWETRGGASFCESLDAMLGSGQLPDCCRRVHDMKGALVVDDRKVGCSRCPLKAQEAAKDAIWVCLRHGDVVFGYLGAQTAYSLGIDSEEESLIVEMAGDVAYALHNLALAEARAEAEESRRAMERQLQQAQRVEAVGRLAGGVAHDFNNMLSVILGNLELAMSALPSDHPVFADLQEAERAGRRSANLTRQLLAFARQQTIAPRVLDLNEALEGMLKMLRRLIGEDIEVVWRPHASVWPLRMDPSQLDQVLANLAVNARDAIAGHGTVTIETDNVTLTEAHVAEVVGATPGDYVLLMVSDTGGGMTPEVRAHLFEPFFTTKGVGGGTGLGLATIYGVVSQNGGLIQVDSELGHGATFRIYLPRYSQEAVVETQPRAQETPRGSGELVLLVEDEASILQMGTRMLERLGYEVVATGNPRAMLRLAEAQGRPPALLISDVVMPGLNGHDLAEQLRQRFPDLRVLFMSGYTADVIATRGVLEEGVHFVGKPFSLRMLGEAVHEALNARS